MTGPLPGAGVAAEGFLRGRWVEEVEVDIFDFDWKFGEKKNAVDDEGDRLPWHRWIRC